MPEVSFSRRQEACAQRLALQLPWVILLTLIPAASGQHYAFRAFGRESGLSNLEIQCFYKDRIGFLWVGTENGLYRYEGGRFTYFGGDKGLPSVTVETIHPPAEAPPQSAPPNTPDHFTAPT